MKITGISNNNVPVNKCSRIATYINKSPKMQYVLRTINRNPSVFSCIAAFLIVSTIRPITIMALPAKNKDDKYDKVYSASSSIATGITDLLAAPFIFVPLNNLIEKSSKLLYHKEGNIFHNNNLLLRKYKSLTNRTLKLVIVPITSLFRFGLVDPIAKKLIRKKVADEDKR